jgi:hypothetical protein
LLAATVAKLFEKHSPLFYSETGNSSFPIFINNKLYYIHQQTAARLLTVNKNRLSSDRLFAVKQTVKQQE